MIVRIQYCVDGTGDVKSKRAVYDAPNHLPFKNFSIEFTWVSCFYLGYFKTWCTLHGNIGQHSKFLKQRKFGVSENALNEYTNFSSAFTNLLSYVDLHYNNLKLRNHCTFPEVSINNLMNFNKPNAHGHKAKPINSQVSRTTEAQNNRLIEA